VEGRKLGGILCEAGPWGLLVGFGLNVAQRGFAGELAARATSLAMETSPEAFPPEPWPGNRARLLVHALREIGRALAEEDWLAAMEERLWGRGRIEEIALGNPGAGQNLRARILGIGGNGALLVEEEGGGRREVLSGEYGTALTAERRII
jgi:biotin-(acetyl-CoA carboxylase) ligase